MTVVLWSCEEWCRRAPDCRPSVGIGGHHTGSKAPRRRRTALSRVASCGGATAVAAVAAPATNRPLAAVLRAAARHWPRAGRRTRRYQHLRRQRASRLSAARADGCGHHEGVQTRAAGVTPSGDGLPEGVTPGTAPDGSGVAPPSVAAGDESTKATAARQPIASR